MSKLVKKPWGGYIIVEKKSNYWIKKLFLKKKEQFSLQSHKKRSELFIVLEGKAKILKGQRSYILEVGDYLKIEKGEKHRIFGLADSCILEVAFGEPKERDIVRYQDDYGRK